MTTRAEDHQNPPAAEGDELLAAFASVQDFTKVFLDGFALIRKSDRKILKFNQMFCNVVGQSAFGIRRVASFDELLNAVIPGSGEPAIEMLLNAEHPMRIDEVDAYRPGSDEVIRLIVSSYPFRNQNRDNIGSCVLMRDVTAESNLQGKYQERTLQSITDTLTGLYVRRYFEGWLDREIERLRAEGTKPRIGLIMFDLDHFKDVNDNHGHQAGDYVLTETARILRENTRRTDVAGRYGGEELLIVLNNVERTGACIAAEKIRRAIADHHFVFQGERLKVTTSVGVTLCLDETDSRSQIIARADQALYEAKMRGRNATYCNFGSGCIPVMEFVTKIP